MANTELCPLAIIGIGCLFPRAPGVADYWFNIKNRVDAITDIPSTHWQRDDYYNPDPKAPDRVYTARGGFLEPISFAPGEHGIAPRDLEAIDTSQLLGLVVAQQALEDAGYGRHSGKTFDRKRASVILGVTGTLELVIPLGARLGHPIWRRALREAGIPESQIEDAVQRIADSYVPWQENSFPGLLGNVVAGRIANRLDLGGTNCVVDAACASSLSSLHLAALELQTGRADLVLTGGVDTFNDIFMFTCFSKTPALSPTGDARPFDASADGTILGEGLGMVVLKRLDDARRDGDRIYAVLRGIGTSSDGRGNAVYAPRAEGQVEALRDAYAVADVTPDTIELVEAHGTGTRVGDQTELNALTEVYRATGRAESWCSLGSVKSQIGHTKAAAGVAGLIKAVLALHHKVLPPTLKVTQPLDPLRPAQSPFQIITEKRPWLPAPTHPRRAAVSAFGFGGSNFHAVLEEAQPDKVEIDWDGRVQILAFTANTVAELAGQLTEAASSTENSWDALRFWAARSRQQFQAAAPCRLLIVVQRDGPDLVRLLETARGLLDRNAAKSSWRSPEGIFFGSGTARGGLAVLFPGQGAQYVGMLRDLACQFPVFHVALCEADCAFDGESRLTDCIYPPAVFSSDERQAQEATLRATQIAQPALGAVSLAAWRVLESFGVQADAALGHSYGELTALCAAGRLDPEVFHAVSRLRGRLMADACQTREEPVTAQDRDPGAMLAVQASLDVITAVLADEQLDLTLANKNAPNQTVLSGAASQIDRAASAFESRQIRAIRLPVAAAFHSPLVAGARQPFRTALDSVDFRPGRIPVVANCTAQHYPQDPGVARDILAEQLARPVEFVASIESLYETGCQTFLEVGPGARLTGLVAAILDGREHELLALDASQGKRSGIFDLACCLAWLAAQGRPIHLADWEPVQQQPPPETGKRLWSVMLCGANFVTPRTPRPATTSKPSMPPASAVVSPSLEPSLRTNGVTTSAMNGSNSHPAPTAVPSPPASAIVPQTSSAALGQALQITRESLLALQNMQQQTAELHQKFLQGQESAQRTLQVLVEQQQQLLRAAVALRPADAPPTPVPMPTASAPMPTPRPVPAAVEAGSQPPPAALPDPHHAEDRCAAVLLAVISEKTGYPAEMLELDMALDADLGIDSIKRVEILSALQERLPDAPTIKPEHLGALHSLRQIAGFLAGSTNGLAKTQPRNPADRSEPTTSELDQVTGVLLQVISEKTGYPPDMLDLNLALDSDLGIDSIKRVEILSALQERLPDAPAIRPEHLGALHNLHQIAAFLAGQPESPCIAHGPEPTRPHSAAGNGLSSQLPATADNRHGKAPGQWADELQRSVVCSVPLPAAEHRPALALPVGSEIWIAQDDTGLAELLEQQLRHKGYHPVRLPFDALARRETSANVAALVLLASRDVQDGDLLWPAIQMVQRAAPALQAAAKQGGAALLTVSRLDGAFGLGGLSLDREPTDAGLAGLAKTAGREWPDVSCKAVDLCSELGLSEAAEAILHELFHVGPLEVGISAQGLCTLECRHAPLPSTIGPWPLEPGDVVVISGGARGVTAAVAEALARTTRATLVLLGRSPAPAPEPVWLAPLKTEAEITRELGLRHSASGLRALAEQCRQILAQRDIRRTLTDIENHGVSALYRTVDVRDASAIAQLLASLKKEVGPIRGLIHGAGVLADARITDKTKEQLQRVYSTKVDGLRSLLGAIDASALRFLVLFSSTTARLGRLGQVDYAMANEVLNKRAQQLARQLPACRVVSINWGPWDGGMVTSAHKRLFDQERVPLIPLHTGAEYLLREICSPGERSVEVVVLGPAQQSAPTNGTCITEPSFQESPLLAVAFELRPDVAGFPVLQSHVLDGRPVVPVALILEWLAHGALHENPGLLFHSCRNLHVLQGIILDDTDPPLLRIAAGKASKRDGQFVTMVELSGVRASSKSFLHARAEVALASHLPAAPPPLERPALSPYSILPAAFYRGQLFHGPDLQCIERVDGCGAPGIAGRLRSAPSPAQWIRQPLRQKWITDPLVIDGVLQLLILWSLQQHQAGCLPCRIGSYRQFRRSFPAGELEAIVCVTRATSLTVHADVDLVDSHGQVVARLEDCESTIDPGLARAFRRNRPLASSLSQADLP